MARLKAANNARTTLAQTIDATVTSFTVADASIFPDPPFRITIDDEIMEVGAKDNATNTFSNVIRGVENTISASHDSGAVVENRFTAGTLAELMSKTGDTMTGDLNMVDSSAIVLGARFKLNYNLTMDSLDIEVI